MSEKPKKKKKATSSQSLAVKYRPILIDDLVGQEAVATQVRGMVKLDRFPTTVGLFGESGGGKTTSGRIIARYINCMKPDKSGNPCGECASCGYETNHPDVHEINMAEARGIDDVRSLIQASRSMPTLGKKRVFILDEMHACFPAGTKVLMEDGTYTYIENIKVGDRVLSHRAQVDGDNHIPAANEVQAVTHVLPKPLQAYNMVRVYIRDSAESYIECTADHKIMSLTHGQMVAAIDFEKGDKLQSKNGIHLYVDRVESIGEVQQVVYDLTVETNHNYFVLPVGYYEPVLVSNCTPQAFQAFLKPLEEPPAHTVWIICTTNPEKMPATIIGRCLKLHIKPIPEEAIIKRLRIIAKREGVDFKEMDGGKEVLSAIANISNGRMRDSIQSLESVLFALASGDEISPKKLIANFARSAEADLDKKAAELLHALLEGDAKKAIGAILTGGNVRGLLSKTRFLAQMIVQQSVGQKFFQTYSWREFAGLIKSSGLKPRLSPILEVQDLLCTVEVQLNSVSIDENVLFTARVGRWLVDRAHSLPKSKES